MERVNDRLAELIKIVDDSEIISFKRVKKERNDLIVSCASGMDHLIRLEDNYISLLRQKWGYEQMQMGGIACPRIEAFAEPSDDFEQGCMILEWLDAVPSGAIIGREGPCEKSFKLCRKLGKALRELHSVQVTPPIPDYIFTHDRNGAHVALSNNIARLREEGLVDTTFEAKFRRLTRKYAELVPEPLLHRLCFTDMHFQNILVYDTPEPTVAGIVDVEEIGVGWPMWDFTNWECWGLRFGASWARKHILAGYGDIDMAMYRFALMVRLSRAFTFVGTTREQITNAVESQDIMALDLDKLYQ